LNNGPSSQNGITNPSSGQGGHYNGPGSQSTNAQGGSQSNQNGNGFGALGGALTGAAGGLVANAVGGMPGNSQGQWPSENSNANSNNAPAGGASGAGNAQQGGHSNMALMTSALAGAGAAMFGNHIMNHGGGQQQTAQTQSAGSGPSSRAFADVEEGAETQSSGHPFVFWTPNNPGSATCKTDVPKRGFPGANAQQTNAAFPSGHQPQNLECWSKDDAGDYKACWYTKVLYDHEEGWPGKCQGLMTVQTNGVSCKDSCERNEACPVWQESWQGSQKVCMQGRGRDCPGQRASNKVNVIGAQRIQHGSVRVLKSLKGTEVKNLRQDFDAKYYRMSRDAIRACKGMCYSDIECAYWVFSETDGCFVEDPPMHKVPYPLTQKDVNMNSAFAKSVIAGEYILHRCPENDGTFTAEDEDAKFTMLPWEWNWFAFHWPWDEGGWPWWGWLIFSILFCCCFGCCLLICGVFGLCKLAKREAKGKGIFNDHRIHEQSDKDSESSYSSDSDSDRKGGHASKQSLLKDQHFNSLAHGHGQAAMHTYH
jgi:hypothetical protein